MQLANNLLPLDLVPVRSPTSSPAVAGSDVHLAVPHSDTAVLAAFIRVAPWAVDPDVRIELPAQLSCRSVNGEHFVERSPEVHDPIDDNWLGRKAHRAGDVDRPGEAQAADVLIRDALQRTEVLRLEIPS